MWDMGVYSNYIWSSYALVFVGMIGLTISRIRKAKMIRRQIRESRL